MDTFTDYLRAQAYNNAWANHRLLGACMRLGQADFEAPRTSFFPSIKATLNHNLTVDWYYIDSMQRSLGDRPVNERFGGFFDPDEPFATCAVLREEQVASDSRLIALCESLDAKALQRTIVVPRQRGLTYEPLPRLLAHLFQHQIHHRGQVHAMLSGTSVEPPQLDEFFCTFDGPVRAADFKVLGFSDAAIWRTAE